MTDGIKRVTLASPAGHTIQAAEDQVDTFLANGWTKPAGRRASADTNPDAGSTPAARTSQQ